MILIRASAPDGISATMPSVIPASFLPEKNTLPYLPHASAPSGYTLMLSSSMSKSTRPPDEDDDCPEESIGAGRVPFIPATSRTATPLIPYPPPTATAFTVHGGVTLTGSA